MHIAAGIPLAHPVEFPHQRYQGVPGARQTLPHGTHVEVREMGLAGDFRCRLRRNDVELRLCLRQGGLDVQPRLVAGCLRKQVADAGVLDA